MSYKRKKKNVFGGKFVGLPHNLLESQAWKNISFRAMFVFIELKKKYNGHNDNNISLTYKELLKRLSTASIKKSFLELEKVGLIRVVRKGGLFRRCNLYGYSEKWRNYSEEAPNSTEIIPNISVDLGKIIDELEGTTLNSKSDSVPNESEILDKIFS